MTIFNNMKCFVIDFCRFNPFKKHELFTLNNPKNREWLEDGDLSKEVKRLTLKEYFKSIYEIFKVNFENRG